MVLLKEKGEKGKGEKRREIKEVLLLLLFMNTGIIILDFWTADHEARLQVVKSLPTTFSESLDLKAPFKFNKCFLSTCCMPCSVPCIGDLKKNLVVKMPAPIS